VTDFDKRPDDEAAAAAAGSHDAPSDAPPPPQPGYPGYPGGYYPPPPPRRSPNSIAMWAHLGVLIALAVGSTVCCLGPLLCWIAPLVIRNDQQNQHDPFIRHHATQALNHAITQTIALTAGMLLGIATYIGFIAVAVAHDNSGAADQWPSAWPVPVITGILCAVLFVYGIAGFVLSIVGTTKANSGQWWSYPKFLAIPFVKG
jgi:uncharacterized Tic20 family protein